MNRPPLGVMPEKIWKSKRMQDLYDAILRYMQAGYPIPEEWVKEYNKLHEEVIKQ
jgi:hypothetical protein